LASTLEHVTASPSEIGDIARAALTHSSTATSHEFTEIIFTDGDGRRVSAETSCETAHKVSGLTVAELAEASFSRVG
jgi:hypothetical protein